MPEKVKIGVDDGCLGLETPSGRMFPVRDHVAELPPDEARRFLSATSADHLHKHRPVAIGWSPNIERALERAFGKENHVSDD